MFKVLGDAHQLSCVETRWDADYQIPVQRWHEMAWGPTPSSQAVWDVEDELHVEGVLGDTGASAVNGGDQSAIQLVHVVLGQWPTAWACLVLNLEHTHTRRGGVSRSDKHKQLQTNKQTNIHTQAPTTPKTHN